MAVAQVADRVEHAREVAGVDHIGFGDHDGVHHRPTRLADVSGYRSCCMNHARRAERGAVSGSVSNGRGPLPHVSGTPPQGG
ncbi:membrane dipeptidase [Streptomyces griseorubiginosus]|uniref:membrane dipeptidase n=1 Tax=Streptomyces griseorubiginosus TaxID=67304 RepID=UPI003F758930